MLHKKDILEYLSSHKDYLRERYLIDRIGIIGSYARGDYKENSDIDFIVYFNAAANDNIYNIYLELQNEMQTTFNKNIDIISNGSVLPGFEEIIKKESIYV
jgi:uncharacterized protein